MAHGRENASVGFPLRPRFIALATAAPVLVATGVFLAVVLATGMGTAGTLTVLVELSGGRRHDPLLAAAVGLAPVLLLLAALALGRR